MRQPTRLWSHCKAASAKSAKYRLLLWRIFVLYKEHTDCRHFLPNVSAGTIEIGSAGHRATLFSKLIDEHDVISSG